MRIELSTQDLLKLGWQIWPCSCHCGHNKTWAIPMEDGAMVTAGCIVCTKVVLETTKVDLTEYHKLLEEEKEIANNERGQDTGGDLDLAAFQRENDLDQE